MKHNKILGILSLSLVLGLVACGGNNAKSTGKTSGKTSKVTSKTSKEPVSLVPQKEVEAQEAVLVKENNKVYFQVTGTYDLYNAGELKFAWGVVGATTGTFYAGKEAPEAADFKADGITMDATAKTFVAKFCLTDVTGLSAAELYNVYVGTQEDTGMMYDVVPVTDASFSDSDANYTYFIRDDQSNAIAVEKAGAIAYSEAKIEALTGEHEGTWLRLYAPNTGWTLESLEALNLVADFQRMAQYSKPKLTADQMFWAIEDGKVNLNMECDQLAAGDSYMTHVGYEGESNPGKLILTQSIMDVEYTIGTMKYTIHFDKTKGQNDGPSEYYGALGIVVEDLAPATEE